MAGSNPWKVSFIVLIFTLFLIGAGVSAYLLGKGTLSLSKISPSPSPTAESGTALTSPTPMVDETAAIKEAMYDFLGKDATEVEVIVTENRGMYATGGVKDIGYEVGGAYWIAAKSGGQWVGVYAGQAHPTCEQIDPYNFPIDMVPSCLNSLGEVIDR
jgi:hypothetical protein